MKFYIIQGARVIGDFTLKIISCRNRDQTWIPGNPSIFFIFQTSRKWLYASFFLNLLLLENAIKLFHAFLTEVFIVPSGWWYTSVGSCFIFKVVCKKCKMTRLSEVELCSSRFSKNNSLSIKFKKNKNLFHTPCPNLQSYLLTAFLSSEEQWERDISNSAWFVKNQPSIDRSNIQQQPFAFQKNLISGNFFR